MSFNYSPKIVTNGLILYLDAANNRSYPGTGTTWIDLSKNGNNGTLINFGAQTIWNSSNGGSIVFDGSDDYVNMGDNDIFTQPGGFTFDIFYKPTTTNGNTILEKYQATGNEYIFGFSGNGLYAWVSDNTLGGYNGRSVTSVSNYVTVNQWNHLVFVYDGGTVATSCKIYINTVQRDNSDFKGGTFSSIRNTLTPLTIALYNNGLQAPIKGSVGSFKMYNRALSLTEITQNYNATKTRFGL